MDDEDSKVRRNLMVASTLVLLAWWLGVPFEKVSERLLGFSPEGKSFEWKVWFAATVGVVYFFLRFRFSEAFSEGLKVYADDQVRLSNRLLGWWLRRETALFARTEGRAPMPVLSSAFASISKAAVKKVVNAYGGATSASVARVIVSSAEFENRFWEPENLAIPVYQKGVAYVQFLVKTPHGLDPSLDGAQPIGFELRWVGRIVAWTCTQGLVLLYSRSSTLLIMPCLLGMWALWISAWQLVTVW